MSKRITRARKNVNAPHPDSEIGKVSQKDEKWDKQRKNTQEVSEHYSHSEEDYQSRHHKLGERMALCSNILDFGQVCDHETGELKLKLAGAKFCHVRHCPVCQWRRALRNTAMFYERLPKVTESFPRARWIFLTLTVKNPVMSDLRSTLKEMNKAWQRLIQRRSWPAEGFIRTTEITLGKDGHPHPHFHCLLLVKPSYFKTPNYISQEKWGYLWMDALRADYVPSVFVSLVKHKTAMADSQEALSAAVVETLKYAVKPEDMLTDVKFLYGITDQLHKTRFLATGGVLKDWMKEEMKNEELVNTGSSEEQTEQINEEFPHMFFNWNTAQKRYKKQV